MLEVHRKECSSLWVPRLSSQCNTGSVESPLFREVVGVECAANTKFRILATEWIRFDFVAVCLSAFTPRAREWIHPTHPFFFKPIPKPTPRPTPRAISQNKTHPMSIQKVRFFIPHFLSSFGGTGGGTEPARDMCSFGSTCSLKV
jgi:hypothetical protein